MIKNVTIIGSGVMGSGIAQSFAIHGYSVVLNDLTEEYLIRAENRIKENLELLVEEGVLTSTGKQKAVQAITYKTDLSEAIQAADFIIEAIPEVIEMKWDLYRKIENLKKADTIVASNTSTFPITKLVEHASFAQKMVITHFFNPGHLVPLVEIVKHEQTEGEVIEATLELMRSIGKSPVLLNKEISGFIANRLQTALMREAFFLLKEGIASAEDIDTAITAGPGFRWAFTGPIEIADFGGLDTWQRVFENVAPDLDQSITAPEVITDLVAENKLGTKIGEGIFKYEASTVSEKLNERDRYFIQLGKIKNKGEMTR
ncbi:3-hydroxyacyl-CoA dehydrogenase family protein [Heyndrickxia sp. NPDC080065]|uniref:3-hydroxyacyl-CoA dehydrogenase family protein n=1 Tax=Heyndrickxia sp. NPDC080065 TaxID=3390568 RepID=UPI003D04931A